jgi:hypothetical protein
MGMDMTSDERDAFYTAVGKLSVTDKNCVGAFAWSAYDPFTTPIWQTGLFDRQGLQRDDIVKPFLNLPL